MSILAPFHELCQEIKQLAEEQPCWLATAESCSGGLVAAALTELPGSSHYYWGGIVCYANMAKERLLNVPAEVLTNYGAVSSETAHHMAKAVLSLAKADISLSITGVAGPGGGSPEKPIGLVWFGLGTPGNVSVIQQNFKGDRAEIRSRTVAFGLEMIRNELIRRKTTK